MEKQGVKFVRDKATHIDPDVRTVFTESGQTLTYDVFSLNAGSYVPTTIVADGDQDLFLVKPIERLLEAKQRFLEMVSQKKVDTGIVGGGPSAAYISGNLLQQVREKGGHAPSITICSDRQLMARFCGPVRRRVGRDLKRRSVRFGGGDRIYFEDHLRTWSVFMQFARTPSSIIALKPLSRKTNYSPLSPEGDYLLIVNRGERTGFLHKRWLTFGGRPAFIGKDYIDRRFMKTFQAIE